MPALTGPALVVAGLLALAGAQKLLDPRTTVGALRALRLPASPALVRLGSVAEVAIGVGAIVVGGAGLWWLAAASYVAFGAFVVAALRRGTMIGSCGCFGREDTPPHWSHVALNAGLAALAAAVATASPGPVLDELADRPVAGAAVVALSGVTLALLHAAFVDLPRVLQAARRVRPQT
jgi:ABC-type branched-subunit amino acid transport system permease subunit